MCTSGAILAPETGSGSMQAFATSLQTGERPDLASSLLVDAEAALMSLGIREAVLSVASALEVQATKYLETQTAISKGAARRAMEAGESFATRCYNELPMAVCGRSLRRESPTAFADVDSVYSQRNGLMHGGVLRGTFRREREIEQSRILLGWLESAWLAKDWLASLSG
jgi:hypothetical protein